MQTETRVRLFAEQLKTVIDTHDTLTGDQAALATLALTRLEEEATSTTAFEPVVKLSKDLRAGADLLDSGGARFLVDNYYALQKMRIATAAYSRSAEDEPALLFEWQSDQMRVLEDQTKNAIKRYASRKKAGVWLQSIVGIGPVLAGGILAHVDMTKTPGTQHLISFAGYTDPSRQLWLKGQKRPWNAKLKNLFWKCGESFVKQQNHKNDIYGKLYAKRKAKLWAQNLNGDFVDAAQKALKSKNYSKSTNAYKFYSGQIDPDWARETLEAKGAIPETLPKDALKDGTPMLPPAHIHARATRFAVKIFISHVWQALYWLEQGDETLTHKDTYAIKFLGHERNGLIPVPNQELILELIRG